jgi:hypothetical protein
MRPMSFSSRISWPGFLLLAISPFGPHTLRAQTPPVAPTPAPAQAPPTPQAPSTPQASLPEAGPIAIVPLDSKNPDAAANVTGALEVSQGKAIIAASGSITSGTQTTPVILPHRGVLRVCASTTVKLAADASVPAGEIPGLLIAMDHGAIEASFAAGRDADILLTPDFRILIGGPGAVDMKVRLGQHGDTCVDNAGINAPYVVVSSVFDGGAYRVQPGQRVMFQHGSLNDVVDQEKEPCGCPPAPAPNSNEFPLAQSEGLAPVAASSPANSGPVKSEAAQSQPVAPLVYNAQEHAPTPLPEVAPQPPPPPPAKKPGFFKRVGNFFKRIFGAE